MQGYDDDDDMIGKDDDKCQCPNCWEEISPCHQNLRRINRMVARKKEEVEQLYN